MRSKSLLDSYYSYCYCWVFVHNPFGGSLPVANARLLI